MAGIMSCIRALQATEQTAMMDFYNNIDRYTRGPVETPWLPEKLRQREQFMKSLVLNGYVNIDDAQVRINLISLGQHQFLTDFHRNMIW